MSVIKNDQDQFELLEDSKKPAASQRELATE